MDQFMDRTALRIETGTANLTALARWAAANITITGPAGGC
jgi:hypothetical protein